MFHECSTYYGLTILSAISEPASAQITHYGVSVCDVYMEALDSLPFPIHELSWDKLDIVAKHLRLKKADAFQLLTNVLGEHPSAASTEFWLHVRSRYSFSRACFL